MTKGATVLVGLRLRAGALSASLALVTPLVIGAQQECEFLAPSGNFSSSNGVTRVSTPHVLCPDGSRIRADSLRRTDSSGYHEFYGSVFFEDLVRILRSDRAQYFANTGRLQAQEDVRLTRKEDNSLVTGENLIYDVGDGETEDRLVVTGGRPHARLYPGADTVRPGGLVPEEGPQPIPSETVTPYEIDADRIVIQGAEDFDASGDVVITRDSLEAFGDRSIFSRAEGSMVLLGRARLIDRGTTLEADSIDLVLPGEVIEEVVARGRGVLINEDLNVRGPLIRLLMTPDGRMERMVTVGETGTPTFLPDALSGAVQPPASDASLLLADHPSRPVVRAQDFIVIADSVDVLLPGEILESLTAVGEAYAESSSRDSLNTAATPDVIRRDWIDGRMIVATFGRDTPAGGEAGDSTAGEYQLERLVASGSARSLYRMPASDSAAADFQGAPRPAVHYVSGDTIVLSLAEGSIQAMDVVDRVMGWHFEPIRRGGSAQPVSPDSALETTPVPNESTDEGPRPSSGPPESDGPPRPEEEVR